MNRKTIQKFIDEVNKETFRKDYVLGMLETLLESLPIEPAGLVGQTTSTAFNSVDLGTVFPDARVSPVAQDEAAQLDLMAKAKLEGVKLMSNNAIQN